MRHEVVAARRAQIEMASSSTGNDGHPVTREDILRLMKAREDIDEQISALGGILESNRVGMTEPLIDNEGYPRNDIDVYQVRHARHKIICLQNDYKALTKEIEGSLARFHQGMKDGGAQDTPMEVDPSTGVESNAANQPIAKVNLVSDGSPAFHAGLKVDDLVLSVGTVDVTNFTSLSQIGSLVQRSAGNVVPVKVKRENQVLKLALIPGPWTGRGLLGCNIIPYENVER